MLAPTEILARQHYDTLRAMAGPTGGAIALLTGRDKGRARESILMGLSTAASTSSSAPTRSSRRR